MDVTDAILKRRSIRNFKPDPVEREKIEKILEAARRAPSWGNTQPWCFIVVQDKARIEELANKAAGGQPQVAGAPVVIVCCINPDAFSRKQHREALKQLIEYGVMDWPDDLLDNVILESEQFAPYRLGEQAMTVKAGEQVMIAGAYMTLEAVNQGLSTCWVGAVSSKTAHEIMGIPDRLIVHDLMLLGYPGEDPRMRPRKDFEKIVFWEKYE